MSSESSEARGGGRLGDYVVVRRIAVGGMAEVFEARRADGGEHEDHVALKVPLPQFAGDEDYTKALAHEARLHASLSHPNLVKVLDWSDASDRPFLVMELVDGLTLDTVLAHLRASNRSIPVDVALSIVADLLRALACLHEATSPDGEPLEVVHRDVTPQNVLVSRRGIVRLGDLGIARSTLRDARTRTGVVKGKVRYLSPEQATSSSVDHRADLYAAGLILFELLTGQPFVQGENELDLLRAAEAPAFRAPSTLVDVDPAVDAILAQALARFPEERYKDASGFLRALEELGGGRDPEVVAEELGALVVEAAASAPARREPELVVLAAPTGQDVTPRRAERTRSLGNRRAQARSPVRLAPWIVGGAAVIVVAIVALLWYGTPRRDQRDERQRANATTVRDDAGLPTATPATGGDSGTPSQDAASTEGDRDAAPPPPHHDASPHRPGRGEARPPARTRHAVASTDDADVAAGPVDHTESAPAEVARRSVLRRRLTAAITSLGQRGVLVEDLAPDDRAALDVARRALDATDGSSLDEAERSITDLERATASIAIDAAFVRRKLDRVSARLRQARARGVETSRLEELASLALQEFADGRYDATNRRLNEILRLLRQAEGR